MRSISSFEYLKNREQFTYEKLKEIRKALGDIYSETNFCIVADGSYARKEASEESDIDFYIIHIDDKPSSKLVEDVSTILSKFVPNMPSDGGPFASITSLSEMTRNIGGDDDTNAKLTKRVLLLLEGDWLYNEALFNAARNNLIETYVNDQTSEPQLALFLLNDFIRYYRTICVDFNYKTVENSKAWGIRNIKLVFSRKLLYFGGIIAVAETAHMTADKKREKLSTLFSLSPLERIRRVCGTEAEDLLGKYEFFLKEISNPEVRSVLKKVDKENRNESGKFRELKNEGHQFTSELYKLLNRKYDSSHPIHKMLVL